MILQDCVVNGIIVYVPNLFAICFRDFGFINLFESTSFKSSSPTTNSVNCQDLRDQR